MALKVTLKTTYKKANSVTGRRETRFIWTVSSNSPKEIEAYQLEQGDNYRADENGKPLFFNKNYPGTRSAELERVTLPDGAVIYRISMMEKDLKIQDMMLGKLAELEAMQEFYGNAIAAAPVGAPAQRGIVPAPATATEELENEPATTGNQDLGDAL